MSLATLTEYYSSLLPYQTRGLPNAVRQVKLWCALMTGENLAADMLTCFDIDTAVGAQLDVIGKYVGVARNIGIVQVRPYFGLWASEQPDLAPVNYQGTWNPITNTPTLGVMGGVGQWWVVSTSGSSSAPIAGSWVAGQVILHISGGSYINATDGSPNGNGLTSSADPGINVEGVFYSSAYVSGQNSDLTDAEYRTVIKLKIVLNSSDGTLASIMDYLQEFFPGLIFLVDNKNMTLSYAVVSTVALSKELLEIYLPRPMGVGITVTIISPIPGGGDTLTTEDGDILTTEGGDPLITETV